MSKLDEWQARELDELTKGAEAIAKGMSNPLLWLLLIGGIVGAVFTGGLSLIITLVAALSMSGGPEHMVKAALPMTVDVVAPKAGCARIVSSIIVIALVVLFASLIVALLAFNFGVNP